jgi:hypothetical protein
MSKKTAIVTGRRAALLLNSDYDPIGIYQDLQSSSMFWLIWKDAKGNLLQCVNFDKGLSSVIFRRKER